MQTNINIKQWEEFTTGHVSILRTGIILLILTERNCLVYPWDHYVQQTTAFLFYSIFVDHASVDSFYRETLKKEKIDDSQAALLSDLSRPLVNTFVVWLNNPVYCPLFTAFLGRRFCGF